MTKSISKLVSLGTDPFFFLLAYYFLLDISKPMLINDSCVAVRIYFLALPIYLGLIIKPNYLLG